MWSEGDNAHIGYFTHPEFWDVNLEVHRKFFIKEKRAYNLKITWWHKRGQRLSRPYRITISLDKWREFRYCKDTDWKIKEETNEYLLF
jgi:hypothetical protein